MKLKFGVGCLLLILSSHLFAWGLHGHALTAQIAYDSLSPKDKVKVNKLATRIYTQLPFNSARKFARQFPNANNFARVAVLPDTWRGMSLAEIFKNFNATLPPVLQPYAENTTNSWHFTDKPIKRKNCIPPHKYNIIWAINTFETAWQQANDKNTQAIIMVFLEHLTGDIHQPLHTFSRYNRLCQNDLGGNALSIKMGSRNTNLHALWDMGIGYFFRKSNTEKKAEKLITEFPKSEFNLNQRNPAAWAQDNLQFSKFIYSVRPNRKVPGYYYKKGKKITRQQITLGGYRLADLLTDLLNEPHPQLHTLQ